MNSGVILWRYRHIMIINAVYATVHFHMPYHAVSASRHHRGCRRDKGSRHAVSARRGVTPPECAADISSMTPSGYSLAF